MPITIKRNDNGSCILFEGSSQPAYWYSCLRAEVDSEDAGRINVINDIRTTSESTEYEFYKMPFTDFVDSDGVAFTDAPEAVAYINENADVGSGGSTGGTVFPQTAAMDFERDATNTTVMMSNGDSYGVNAIRAEDAGDGTISLKTARGDVTLYSGLNHSLMTIGLAAAGATVAGAVNALNAYFTVSPVSGGGDYVPSFETLTGTPVTGNDAEGQVPTTGSPTHLLTTGSDTGSGHGARYWSDETIDQAGEYFTVKVTGQGRFILGLTDTGDAAQAAALLNNTGNGHSGLHWGLAVYDYGSYKAPWTTYGTGGLSYGPGWSFSGNEPMMRYNTNVQDAFDNMDAVLFKVGIDSNGYAAVWYWDDGRTNDWILCGRRGQVTPSGNYGLVVKLWDSNCTLVETPLRNAVDPVAPTMTYFYAESPDGVFNYPLFQTSEEAEHYDTTEGGSGSHQEIMFIDDTVSGRVWYAPTNGYYTSDGTSAPSNTGSVTWNAVTTQSDNLFAPDAFSGSDHSVDELSAVNIAISPLDVTYTTTVSISPSGSGLSLVANNLEGTAPEVAGDNVTNPSDSYTVTVTRTNNYGTSSGSFTITVANLTAPTVAASGFTHVAGSTALVDSATLGDGSAVAFDDTLASPRRFIIPKAWVEDNILPQVVSSGTGTNSNPGTAGRSYIGVKASGGDLTDGITDADFDMFFNWEYQTASGHRLRLSDGSSVDNIGIGGTTSSLYDFAIEVDGTDIHLLAGSLSDLNNQPGVGQGGSFSRVKSVSGYAGTLPLEIVMGTNGVQAELDTVGLNTIIIPAPANWIQVTEASAHVIEFDGSTAMPTLNAGYTYRFLVGSTVYADQTTPTSLHTDETLRFTADGVSEYTTGITRVGAAGAAGSYVEFAVPSDVPPLYWYTDHSGIGTSNAASLSGSTHSVTITGIALEGPAANQTGSNVMDAGDHGWISLDEQLHAGERLVLDNAFWADFLAELDDNTNIFAIGLKGDNWVNTKEVNNPSAAQTGEFFKGDTYIVGQVANSSHYIYLRIYSNGSASNQMLINTSAMQSTVCAFLELTGSGNNIRAGFGRNGQYGVTQGSESTVSYGAWASYKAQTGEQGYGITAKDVMVAFWTYSGGAIDGDDIDWTGLTEVSTPTAAASLTTPWNKALDFSGSSERMQQLTNSSIYNPIRMDGLSVAVVAPSTPGTTSSSSLARPWHTAVVFSADNHNSNQHIWNQGEGSASTHDNIYLRLDANRQLFFGWGRDGALNECSLGTLSSGSGNWYGIYVAHTGERLTGSNASAANLATCFEIYGINLQTGVVGSNLSTASNWTTTGGRMDRQVDGDLTVGGRGANRTFHGKVASMVISTLRVGQTMPAAAEISMMVRDPLQWLADYKVGANYRPCEVAGNNSGFALNNGNSMKATQVWLMGDGASDAYAQIRNQVYPAFANFNVLNMISMVSNDIETVNINGLT